MKFFVCRLCLSINFIFLFDSENISFYHILLLNMKSFIFDFKLYFILIFIVFIIQTASMLIIHQPGISLSKIYFCILLRTRTSYREMGRFFYPAGHLVPFAGYPENLKDSPIRGGGWWLRPQQTVHEKKELVFADSLGYGDFLFRAQIS